FTLNGKPLMPRSEPIQTGLELVTKASVSEDQKQVTLALKVKKTELDREGPRTPFARNIVLKDGTSLVETTFVHHPQAKTLVDLDRTYTLNSGQTAILGAWKKTMQVKVVDCGPPILRDIPIVNWLFEDEHHEPHYQVVLLMVTPRVVV